MRHLPPTQQVLDLSQLERDTRVAVCSMMGLGQLLKLDTRTQHELLESWGLDSQLDYDNKRSFALRGLGHAAYGQPTDLTDYEGESKPARVAQAYVNSRGGRIRYLAVNRRGVAIAAAPHADELPTGEGIRHVRLEGEAMTPWTQRHIARILSARLDRRYQVRLKERAPAPQPDAGYFGTTLEKQRYAAREAQLWAKAGSTGRSSVNILVRLGIKKLPPAPPPIDTSAIDAEKSRPKPPQAKPAYDYGPIPPPNRVLCCGYGFLVIADIRSPKLYREPHYFEGKLVSGGQIVNV